MNPAGGGVSAWPSADSAGHPAVAVREDFPDGAVQTALVGGGAGGPIGELAVGRSGLGDGLIGFLQGPLGNAAIVAAQVTAPPARTDPQRAQRLGQARPGGRLLAAGDERRRAAHLPASCSTGTRWRPHAARARCAWTRVGSAAAVTACRCSRPTSTASRR